MGEFGTLAGSLLAQGRIDEAMRVVEWQSNALADCECGQRFDGYGFHIRCPECRIRRCQHPKSIDGYMVTVTGQRRAVRACLECGDLVELRSGQPAGPYCFKDNRRILDCPPCARCGSTNGVERHHWAPRAIFGSEEAERWPTAHLCRSCHDLWHDMMRKARGVSLSSFARIDD